MSRGWSRFGISVGGVFTSVALLVALIAQFAHATAAPSSAPIERSSAGEPEPSVRTLALDERAESSVTASPLPPADPERPDRVVSIALGPGMGPVRDALERWMAQLWSGYVPEFMEPPDEATDLYVGHLPPYPGTDGYLLDTLFWVPVTRFTSDVDDIASEALRAAFTGKRASWSELQGDDVPIVKVLVADNPVLGAAALGLEPDDLRDVTVITPAELSGRAADLAAEPGLLMLVPMTLVDSRFHAMMVDGASPLFQRGSDATYALKTERWLGVRREGWDDESDGRFIAGLVRFVVDDVADSPPRVTTVTAAGDMIFGRKVDEKLVTYGDYTRPFHVVGDELRRADVTIANLECTLTDSAAPPHDWSTFTFGTSTRAVEGVRFAGIDVVSLANNHSRDMGPAAFVEMLDVLTETEIGYMGGGRNVVEAHAPYIVDVRGIRFAFLGYDDIAARYYGATEHTPGTAAVSEEAVRREVAAAREMADVVVPFFHWGVEYTNVPTERQRRIAHAAVEAGAALVLGSHQHWVQAVEFYEGAFIAYGLGNFVFDQNWSTETMQGVIMQTSWVNGRLSSLRFLPYQIEDLHQPTFVDRRTGRRILNRMFDVSDL